ncbi:MAG: elongation factor EF-2 [Candidatus Bathyarchaeia archaeon]
MPKFRQTAELLKLMGKKERIRNVCVVAHIDHGKTTMTDSLLIEAGLLPSRVTGSARVLDYLEEEQKRGITIKTANISFLHEVDGSPYLINLVDTPGHVDFTGKVTRALRAVDGAIVVVDAVEEVMAQTETVTRQALEERVRPVLFINKVDRLIRELKLSPDAIQKKFVRIITDFNNIIEIYGEPRFSAKWKVDPSKQSVVFGSALHRWGFTLEIAEKKGIRFSDRDIADAYEHETWRELSKVVPLYTAILDMVVKNLPSPLESQRYRVPKIWKGSLTSEIGQAMANCDDQGPTVIGITAAQVVQNEGLVATGRIFSGSVKKGDDVYLVGAGKVHCVQQVSLYMSAFRETVSLISAGNIAALTGLESARAGETVVDVEHKSMSIPFGNAQYVSEPVMTIAIEPKNPKDLESLLEGLKKLSIEDPNLITTLDTETGQHLLSGMGELHLEVAMNFLKKYIGDVKLEATSPIAAYRETVLKSGALVMTNSPNKRNKFWIKIEPLESKAITVLEKSLTYSKSKFGKSGEGEIWAVDERINVLVDSTKHAEHLQEVKNDVVSGFYWACRTGPLSEHPLRGVKVKLMDVKLDGNPENREPSQVTRAISRAILGSLLTANPALLEPIYKVEVSVPLQWLGTCSKIITRRHGKIEATQQKGQSAIITGYVPVAQTLGLPAEMRAATSGHVFWQLTFDHWEKMAQKLEAEVVTQLRVGRGLPAEVPQPKAFVDEILS